MKNYIPLNRKTLAYWLLFFSVTSKSIAHGIGDLTELHEYLGHFLPKISNKILPIFDVKVFPTSITDEELKRATSSFTLAVTCWTYILFKGCPLLPMVEYQYALDATQKFQSFILGDEMELGDIVKLRVALTISRAILIPRSKWPILLANSPMRILIDKLNYVEHFRQNSKREYVSVSEIINDIEKL